MDDSIKVVKGKLKEIKTDDVLMVKIFEDEIKELETRKNKFAKRQGYIERAKDKMKFEIRNVLNIYKAKFNDPNSVLEDEFEI